MRISLIRILTAGGLMAMAPIQANATMPLNQVPSCYAANPKIGIAAPMPQRWLYIVIDQTVVLDEHLKNSLASLIKQNIQAGTGFSVIGFSAFSQGRYMSHIASGIVEPPITDKAIRNDVSVPALKKFDECIQGQYGYSIKLAYSSVGKALGASSSDLAKSDVISSLSELSHLVRENPAIAKKVLLVSDMLENSSVTSFYSNNAVRKIDPSKELKRVDDNGLYGDFAGAGIYVMGAGMTPQNDNVKNKTAQYRDPQTMSALKQFWSQFFTKSNGKLEGFGAPELLSTIQW